MLQAIGAQRGAGGVGAVEALHPLRGVSASTFGFLVTTITAFMREIGWNRTTPCPSPPSPV